MAKTSTSTSNLDFRSRHSAIDDFFGHPIKAEGNTKMLFGISATNSVGHYHAATTGRSHSLAAAPRATQQHTL